MKAQKTIIDLDDILKKREKNLELREGINPDKKCLPIGTAAELLNITPKTLRIYEKEGLIEPLKKGNKRYFSYNDLQWISCIRRMIHENGINISGLRKLLSLIPCWSILNCPLNKRKDCTAYRDMTKKD